MTIYYPPLTESALDGTGVLLMNERGNRQKVLIQADDQNSAIVRIYLLTEGGTTISTESFLELAAGGLYDPSPDECPKNAIWAKSASGTQTIRWTEV